MPNQMINNILTKRPRQDLVLSQMLLGTTNLTPMSIVLPPNVVLLELNIVLVHMSIILEARCPPPWSNQRG